MRQVGPECWVLLVTDTNARTGDKLHFYAGRFRRDGGGFTDCEVPDGTWQGYLDTVARASDMLPSNFPSGAPQVPKYQAGRPEYTPVASPADRNVQVGERLRARPYLHVGQPVWVETGLDGTVSELRLSLLWRYQGDQAVGERAGEAVPCRKPDELCWSCCVFGSADTTARTVNDLARQDGYRGHVRFEDLLGRDQLRTGHLASRAAARAEAQRGPVLPRQLAERRFGELR
jgi:hypothetical protein